MLGNISKFLEKFKESLGSEDDFREETSKTISEITGFPIEKEKIFLKGGIVKIKCDSYMKTEISLHKEKILENLKSKFPKKNIKDIF